MKTKIFRIISFSAIGVLLAVTIAVNVVCGIFSDVISLALGATTALDEESLARGSETATQVEAEGIVMTKNEVLPLDKSADTKINVFGWSSTQWIMGGSGSGRSVQSLLTLTPEVGLLEALTNYGISYNSELTDMYKNFLDNRPFWRNGTLNTHSYEYSRIYEPSVSDTSYYTSSLLNNAKTYSDAAIVVIGRVSGESNDSPKVQYKNYTENGFVPEENTDATRTYLEISTEEEELLRYVGANFEKVIVVINSTNTMNLGFMDEIAGLDACLIVGGTGNKAAEAIPKILYGEENPSGRTADTYPYSFETDASYANAGMEGVNQYTNGDGLYPTTVKNGNVGTSDNAYPGVSYLDYAEGIYVGYKWYETADAEGFWKDYGGYDKVVQYPFGYGLSYTEFSWEIVSTTPENGEKLTKDGTISIKVKVTNTGNMAGKDVVEAYFTPPYTPGGIEKSSVNLCAFAKTDTLEPNEEQELVLTFNVSDMTSYDSSEIKVQGGGYILEEGDYEISLRTDAHSVVASVTYRADSDIIYDADTASGKTVKNIFTGSDAVDGISLDGSDSNANIVYLSRADFKNTFPSKLSNARAMTQNLIDTNLYTEAQADEWLEEQSETAMPAFGAKNNMTVYNEDGSLNELGIRLGQNYADPDWDKLLDQITLDEMKSLILHGYAHEEAIDSIGKKSTKSVDGPSQIGSFNQRDTGTAFPNPTVMAQTWNKELVREIGATVGNEAQNMGYSGWYAPGINIHRSAFGGRNYEYFSEDAYLTGIMAAAQTEGCLSTGTYLYAKHFVAYDQESFRDGLYVWMTEQTLREIYARPFKIAIDEGGLTGIMSSYGRIGAIWAGGSRALLTSLLRDEWDFHGAVLTDYSDHQQYMNGDQMLRAGGDLWMDGATNTSGFKMETESVAFANAAREATKHVLYMIFNAAGVSQGVSKWWVGVLVAADVIIVLGCGIWAYFALRKKKPVKDKE